MSRRVRRIAFAATVVTTLALVGPAFAASSGTATTTLGQTMTASIDSPTDQQRFTVGNSVTVSGKVTLTAPTTVQPTNVSYMLDISGSTINTPCKPLDPNDTQLVLDCEKKGTIALNNSIKSTPQLNVAVQAFSDAATTETAGFVAPTSPTVNSAINGLSGGGYTNYNAALTEINTLFTGVPAANRKVVFFLSDGNPEPPSNFTTGPGSPLDLVAAAGIVVNTYSVGDFSTRCPEAGSALKQVADATGGQCTDVADPSKLATNLANARVDVKMNGKAALPATVNGNNWTVTFNQTNDNTIALGNNPIVATVTAPDGTKLDVNITIIGDPPPTTTTTSTTVPPVVVTPRFTG